MVPELGQVRLQVGLIADQELGAALLEQLVEANTCLNETPSADPLEQHAVCCLLLPIANAVNEVRSKCKA